MVATALAVAAAASPVRAGVVLTHDEDGAARGPLLDGDAGPAASGCVLGASAALLLGSAGCAGAWTGLPAARGSAASLRYPQPLALALAPFTLVPAARGDSPPGEPGAPGSHERAALGLALLACLAAALSYRWR